MHSGGFNKNATTSTKSVVFNDLIAASASAREQSAIEHTLSINWSPIFSMTRVIHEDAFHK
jgi:hypothetical protein